MLGKEFESASGFSQDINPNSSLSSDLDPFQDIDFSQKDGNNILVDTVGDIESLSLESQLLIAEAQELTYQQLQLFASNTDKWQALLTDTFGHSYDRSQAENLQSLFAASEFADIPNIEILKPDELTGGLGAYNALGDRLFLSEDLIKSGDAEDIAFVLGEELGHWLDDRLNTQDTVGDEGEIFVHSLFNKSLSETELHALRQEDDKGFITVDGETLAVEFKNITGNNRNNTLIGTNAIDTIRGRGGADTIRGRGRNDKLFGDLGNDKLFGEAGNDKLYGNGGSDILNGGGGKDILIGSGGNDRLNGNGGNDTLNGGGGKDILNGHGGNDKLNGNGGNDILNGGSGKDILNGNAGNDRLNGGDGNDILKDGTGKDILIGGKGADTFVLGTENNTFYSQNGNLDHAIIQDFNLAEDKIQLRAINNSAYAFNDAYGYIIKNNGNSTEIRVSNTNELIGVIQNTNNLSLLNNYFDIAGISTNILFEEAEDHSNSTPGDANEAPVKLSGDTKIDGLLSNNKWGFSWGGKTLTYSFYESSIFQGDYYGDQSSVREVSEAVKKNVRNIFDWLENIIDINFEEVIETRNNYGRLRFMLSDGPNYAYAYYPFSDKMDSLSGDIHLTPKYDTSWDSNTNNFRNKAGTHGYMSLVHEIGHALGLKHPHDGAPKLSYSSSNTTNTVMTYNFTGNSAGTFMPFDVKALQYLYGAKQHRTGNSTYKFTDGIHNFTINGQKSIDTSLLTKQTIWDSDGLDTLDFSDLKYNYSGYRFDLREGGLLTENSAFNQTQYKAFIDYDSDGNRIETSTTYRTTTYGTSIAYNVNIENLINSSSNDIIYANDVANSFKGYAPTRSTGNDVIYNTNSQDTLDLSSYTSVVKQQNGNDLVISLNGNGSIRIKDYYVGSRLQILEGKPKVTLSISPSSINEDDNNNLVYTFTRTGSTANPLTVDFDVNGNATWNSDYSQLNALSFNGSSGSIRFGANQSTKTLIINPTADSVVESNETVGLTLRTSSNYNRGTTGTITGTILNDDLPSLSISNVTLTEGDSGTKNAIFTVTRSGTASQAITVNYATANGSAIANSDYFSRSGSLTFATNQTARTISVPVIGDTALEGDETFFVNLSNATNATISDSQGRATIINNDVANQSPTITSSANVSTDENDPHATTIVAIDPENDNLNFTITGGEDAALFQLTRLPNLAGSNNQYSKLSFIAAPDFERPLDQNQDNTYEIQVKVNDGNGGNAYQNLSIDVNDLNELPTVTIQATDANAAEVVSGQTQNPGQFTLTRTGSTDEELLVSYQVYRSANLTGQDYDLRNSTLSGVGVGTYSAYTVFAAGSSTAVITLDAIDDTRFEDDETLRLVLIQDNDSYSIGGSNEATVTIFDNETSPPFIEIAHSLPGVHSGSVDWGDYNNDGLLDVLITGSAISDNNIVNDIARVYRNTGNGFVDINAGLTGVYISSGDWGDYNNDGLLDIAITGLSRNGLITKVYRNTGTGFVDINAGLDGVSYGSAVWGDYDNDGRLDLLVTGNSTSGVITKVYRNTGNGFADSGINLPGLYYSTADWGDYDNDGRLDILINGKPDSQSTVSKIYRNTGSGFVERTLVGSSDVSANWGDYDNDGRLDILLGTKVYKNIQLQSSGSTSIAFAEVLTGIPSYSNMIGLWGDYDNDGDLDIFQNRGLVNSNIFQNTGSGFSNIGMEFAGLDGASVDSASWGDYDNDGRLDLILTGRNQDFTYRTKIYRNIANVPTNTPPSSPTNLNASVDGTSVDLSWNKAFDLQTSQDGLTYNLRIGKTAGGSEVMSEMSTNSGTRLNPRRGNVDHNLSWSIQDLSPGTYYWSVQSVDSTFVGSSFATEGSFVITSESSITQVGSYNTPSDAYEVHVVGNYAYIADNYSGLQILDVSNPDNPFYIGSYDTPSRARDIQVVDNYAYVADYHSGLQIIDISNPSAPSIVGSYDTYRAEKVHVVGNYAYIADDSSGLKIIDVSNPITPFLVGSYDTTGNARDIQVVGDYAYIAGYNAGLQIINISNPNTPFLVGSYNETPSNSSYPNYTSGVQVVGDYAYIADGFSGLQIIDISNPSSPSYVGSYDTPDYAGRVRVLGNYAYITDRYLGIKVIDISNSNAPVLSGSHDTPNLAIGIQILGNYAYVADLSGGLRILDVSDFRPRVIAGG